MKQAPSSSERLSSAGFQHNLLFDLHGSVILVTGATGALAGSAAKYLAMHGSRVVYLGRSQDKLDTALLRLRTTKPDADYLGLVADVLDRAALERTRDDVLARRGHIDGLVNDAGGNIPGATVPPGKAFADLDFEAFQQVVVLNLHGTVLPSLVFTPAMDAGAVVNFSSASAPQAVTRVVGYADAHESP